MLSILAAIPGASMLGSLGCSTQKSVGVNIDGDLTRLGLSEAAALVQSRKVSPVELTKACLERIGRLDGRLNSFITVTPDKALTQAHDAERAIARGDWFGPLHGIPIAVKDNVDTAGVFTTAASGVFADRVPVEDAEVIKRLKAAGAVILGKLNMHEFALGTTSAISRYGPVHNPWALDRVAGGSSGGSGAAVAAGLCYGAVGTDTGGSVRIPAACCGIVGLKPTYGVVSTQGTIPVSTSFDHVGPMCRTVLDTAIMFRAMTDHRTAAEIDPKELPDIARLTVGILSTSGDVCDAPVEPEVQAVFNAAVEVLRSLGIETGESQIQMPDLGGVIDYESYAYHTRYLATSSHLYDPKTRETILPGKNISKQDFKRMVGELEVHRRSIGAAFANVDLMILPTLPGLPIEIKDAKDPFSLNACTFAFSIGGLPAISVPCGFSKTGLPIGMLIAGPPYSEGKILAVAAAYEKAAGWEKRRPPI